MSTEVVGTLRVPQGLTVEWEIPDYFDRKCECLDSPKFSFLDARWHIRIDPNGTASNETCGWTCMYVMKNCSLIKEHYVTYVLGIKKADNSIYCSHEGKCLFINGRGFGPPKSLTPSKLLELKNILAPDNVLRIFCILRTSRNICVETATQTSLCVQLEALSQNLSELYVNGCHSDVTVKVKDKEFQVHKSMLSARSTVFSSMFAHDTAENRSGVVDITDCDPDSFTNFLLYIYTGTVNAATCSDACGLYKIADKYDLQLLKPYCVTRMTQEMSVESFCDVTFIAAMYDEPELLKTVKEFFNKNMKNIFPSIEWQLFMKNHLTIANELLINMADNVGVS